MYSFSFSRKKLSTLTTDACDICASARPSSKKLLSPRRYSESFSDGTLGSNSPRARGQRCGQVFLDGHLLAFGIQGQIDHAEAARGQPAHHAVAPYDGIWQQRSRLDF